MIVIDGGTVKHLVTRLGIGKVCHMEVKFLWAQEPLRRKLFEIRKVAGDRNRADVLTKATSMAEMKEKIESIGGLCMPTEISRDVGVLVVTVMVLRCVGLQCPRVCLL